MMTGGKTVKEMLGRSVTICKGKDKSLDGHHVNIKAVMQCHIAHPHRLVKIEVGGVLFVLNVTSESTLTGQ